MRDKGNRYSDGLHRSCMSWMTDEQCPKQKIIIFVTFRCNRTPVDVTKYNESTRTCTPSKISIIFEAGVLR
jgi:hypothetical protein